jgi:hypothetical protein
MDLEKTAAIDTIKLVKSFIDDAEAASLIEHIDHLECSKTDAFNFYQDGKRASLQFGYDTYYGMDPSYKFFLDLEILRDSGSLDIVKKNCLAIINKTKELFLEEEEDIYISAFWLAKQYPGATIPPHSDTEDGYNLQYIYSAILYLNTLNTSGELSFVDLNCSYEPEGGDLIVFPTQGTGIHTVSEISEDRYSIVLWLTKDKSLSVLGAGE